MGCCGSLCGSAAKSNGSETQDDKHSSSSSKCGGQPSLKKQKNKVGAEVKLHVYDVRGNVAVEYMNNLFRMLGTGAFHVAVEVYGDEWSYGYMNDPPGCTGVFNCTPGQNTNFGLHRDSISLGMTSKDEDEVDEIIKNLCEFWKGEEYDLLRHNCCYFSDEFCRRLEVGPFPDWIKNLAGAGAKLTDALYKVTEIRHIVDLPRDIVLKLAKGEVSQETATEEAKQTPSFQSGGGSAAPSTKSSSSLFTATSIKGAEFVKAMSGVISNNSSAAVHAVTTVSSNARKLGMKRVEVAAQDSPKPEKGTSAQVSIIPESKSE
mmetsp:Transcript_6770/g.11050  ORF Transcript_6770/g.11050 Transcript_6770/m.11050 type:complete len:318 (+) Transcript_6770:52-1005(+)|eukprot:CAMPEP_0169079004 /NCGR_PEP_ID=MMETSP1015-20121227/9711_1 /TAXON_ID=342587 /ORGANISM="Karlodinium micrum, Strain CCMP2283" /LENGTH=317 /DNA_ID=CAMNT_0009138627 /DNA_START=51 /DNA_END=1004 /DNA_ORIENTATION=-